ncbi:MAG TPA: hypothetical protein PK156_26455 [Polyangium sp.]|nr:hypothetical protein [Polyangium sp.]
MHVRVVRLQSPRLATNGPPIYRALSLARDRFVAYVNGNALHVLDLEQGDETPPILVVENGINHAFVGDTLITYDETHQYRRFVREGNKFVEASRFVLPETPAPWPTHLVLSPSGRFLCVEWPPAPNIKGCRVALIDTSRGEILTVLPRALSARASFGQLQGEELLFLSAPSYMDVTVLDAATGKKKFLFDSSTSWDFCHTDYEISSNGERLLTFGCVWAAPYEVRLYDTRPWTRGSQAPEQGFSLPLIYSQYEDLQYETILPARFDATNESLLDVYSIVSLGELQNLSAEDAKDLEEGLSAMNLSILEAARGIAAKCGLLQRRVSTQTGEVQSFRISAAQELKELHVHQLPGHQALSLGEVIQWFDGERMHDIAPFAKPPSYFESRVSRNGDIVVVREVVGA